MRIQRRGPRRSISTPWRGTRAKSRAAPSTRRAQERKKGEMPSSTAILMNRYGTPQMSESAAKAIHPRRLIGSGLQSGYGGWPQLDELAVGSPLESFRGIEQEAVPAPGSEQLESN